MTKLCKTKIPADAMDHILNNFREMMAINRRDGRVSTIEMDTLNIYKVFFWMIVYIVLLIYAILLSLKTTQIETIVDASRSKLPCA